MATTVPIGPEDARPRFILDLAHAIADHGHEVDILTPHVPGAKLSEVEGRVRIERFRYWWPEGAQRIYGRGGALPGIRKNPLAALQIPSALGRQVFHARLMATRRRYDLLHAHWLFPSGLAAALTNRRFIASALGADILLMRSQTAQRVNRFVLSRAAAVTASSRTLAEGAVEACPDAHVDVVPFGITEMRRVEPRRAEEIRAQFGSPLVVFVARLAREKGGDILLRALCSMPDVKAVIAGEGPERASLERLTAELGIADRVAYPGWVPASDVPNWMAAADCVVVPSISEGQGLTAPEAMASGAPLVASRVDGLAETITHEQDGLLVEPGSPDALARAVRRVIEDPELRARLVEGGRRRASDFTIQATANGMLSVYARVLEDSR